MHLANLSSKGQLVIPKNVRDRYGWKSGQQFELVEHEDGIFLRLHKPFDPTELQDVAGRMHYEGEPVAVEVMKGNLALSKKHGWD